MKNLLLEDIQYKIDETPRGVHLSSRSKRPLKKRAITEYTEYTEQRQKRTNGSHLADWGQAG